jgi:putative DNA primase/helicase
MMTTTKEAAHWREGPGMVVNLIQPAQLPLGPDFLLPGPVEMVKGEGEVPPVATAPVADPNQIGLPGFEEPKLVAAEAEASETAAEDVEVDEQPVLVNDDDEIPFLILSDDEEPADALAQPKSLERPNTDLGNSEAFCDLHGDFVRYDHARGRWLIWRPNEHRWRSDGDGAAVRLAVATVRQRMRDALSLSGHKRRAALDWALKSEARSRLDAMLAIAKNLQPVADSGGAWDTDPWLLGTPGGVVDLQTGVVRDGQPEDRITMSTAVLAGQVDGAPQFQQFLKDVLVDEAIIAFVQRAAGYATTGLTREQVFFHTIGTGGNGKSALLNILRGVLGDYGGDLPFSALTAGKQNSGLFDLARLPGQRFVTCSEVNEGVRIDEARIKALTGGDPMAASEKGKPQFSFRPAATLWLASNSLPRVRDASSAFWRRARLIEFHRQFGLINGVQGHKDERGLADRLVQEEGPGILAWLIEGAVKYAQEGLGEPPASVTRAVQEWRGASDDVAAFVDECCVTGAGKWEGGRVLYQAYLVWTQDRGAESLTETAFGNRLKARFDKKHTVDGVRYLGVSLKVMSG